MAERGGIGFVLCEHGKKVLSFWDVQLQNEVYQYVCCNRRQASKKELGKSQVYDMCEMIFEILRASPQILRGIEVLGRLLLLWGWQLVLRFDVIDNKLLRRCLRRV